MPRLGPRRFVLDAREIAAPVGGDPLLLLAIADVTERRLAEAARARVASLEQEARIATRASEDKDVFLAGLSHELRTPLNSILLWAQVLQSEKVDPAKVARGIDTMARSARTQSMLINDFLDVSRIVSGKLEVTLSPVALAPVIATALEHVQPEADEKGVKLEVSVDPGVGEVAADANRLRQIVWNLASNAVKFTPAGGMVQVSAEPDGDQARVTVRDTGAGIEPAFLPRVFDRFAQADKSATRPHGGLGLGLAIVAYLVERHGGTIHAASPGPGRGSTFTVTIPLIAGAEKRDGVTSGVSLAAASAPPRRDPPRLDGLRVLIVDDDNASREAVSETLLGRGASVVTAETVVDALDQVDRVVPDVILCDVAMPGQDGYAFLQQLRARPADRGGLTPVAALTAHAASQDRSSALGAGFQLHLAKPIDAVDLALAVDGLAHGEAGSWQ
jgi:signal transduction histidine kinase/ActR/RegA family two-component response regulator